MTTKADIKKGTLINTGNFIVSVGHFDSHEIAIMSKHTHEFVKLERAKTNNRLRSVKRKFKSWLNSDDTFTFSFMQPEQVVDMIKTLK